MAGLELARAQALIAQGRFLRGLREAEALADQPDLPTDQRTRALLLACRAAASLGMFHKAGQHAARARGLAEAAGDQEGAGLALFYAGKAALEAGDWYEAEASTLAFLATAERFPVLARLCLKAELNLAVAYEGLKRADAALSLYERVAARAFAEDDLGLAVLALQNAAWLLLLGGRTDEAARHLSQCTVVLPSASPEQQAHQIVLEALVQLRSARYLEAIELSEEILSAQHAGATDWDRTAAAWVAASAALDLGRADMAGSLLQLAVRYVSGAKDTRLMNLVSDLNRQLRVLGEG